MQEALSEIAALADHPNSVQLIEIVTGETDVSSAGFPYISDRSFRLLAQEVPHLYRDGTAILQWLEILESETAHLTKIPESGRENMDRAIKVLRTIVYTAGVTATPDLWILKHVLSAHKQLGILEWLASGQVLNPGVYVREHGMNEAQLTTDLHFLHSRGYLHKSDGEFVVVERPGIADVLRSATAIPPEYQRNLVPTLTEWLSTSSKLGTRLTTWLEITVEHKPTGTWVASQFHIELAYRLLPVVLSLRVLEITTHLQRGQRLADHISNLPAVVSHLFEIAGFIEEGFVNELGARVFARAPGAFGIIGAYHPYLSHLRNLLQSAEAGTWVHRGENVAASQDANRKTFSIANDKLDKFSAEQGFAYSVFIEHAVGRGEAIRQRFERDGEETLQYFGADLEDAAIDQAMIQQGLGVLPSNLRFIRSADIGEPRKVIEFLTDLELGDEPTVMMVGNGFHEIREQTNEKMVAVFREYAQGGYLLIFTEESALQDEALIRTAWNTYHAGFRYVHEMSGQSLRPAVERDGGGSRWSWRKCAERGGYRVLDKYGYRSRTIYPYKLPRDKNPAISVTYFCVPDRIAKRIGINRPPVAKVVSASSGGLT